MVDDLRRREIRAGIHTHVERSLAAKAEASFRVIDLGAGEAEVEKDQVRRVETVLLADRAQLGEATMDDDGRGSEFRQRLFCGRDCRGIAVDPQKPAAREDRVQDLAGVARLPEGAVDRDRPQFGLEQLYYLL